MSAASPRNFIHANLSHSRTIFPRTLNPTLNLPNDDCRSGPVAADVASSVRISGDRHDYYITNNSVHKMRHAHTQPAIRPGLHYRVGSPVAKLESTMFHQPLSHGGNGSTRQPNIQRTRPNETYDGSLNAIHDPPQPIEDSSLPPLDREPPILDKRYNQHKNISCRPRQHGFPFHAKTFGVYHPCAPPTLTVYEKRVKYEKALKLNHRKAPQRRSSVLSGPHHHDAPYPVHTIIYYHAKSVHPCARSRVANSNHGVYLETIIIRSLPGFPATPTHPCHANLEQKEGRNREPYQGHN